MLYNMLKEINKCYNEPKKIKSKFIKVVDNVEVMPSYFIITEHSYDGGDLLVKSSLNAEKVITIDSDFTRNEGLEEIELDLRIDVTANYTMGKLSIGTTLYNALSLYNPESMINITMFDDVIDDLSIEPFDLYTIIKEQISEYRISDEFKKIKDSGTETYALACTTTIILNSLDSDEIQFLISHKK